MTTASNFSDCSKSFKHNDIRSHCGPNTACQAFATSECDVGNRTTAGEMLRRVSVSVFVRDRSVSGVGCLHCGCLRCRKTIANVAPAQLSTSVFDAPSSWMFFGFRGSVVRAKTLARLNRLCLTCPVYTVCRASTSLLL